MNILLKRGLATSMSLALTALAAQAQDYNIHVDGTQATADSFFLDWNSAAQTFNATNLGSYTTGGVDFPFAGPLVNGDPYTFVAVFGADHVVVAFNNGYVGNVVGKQFEAVLGVNQADFRNSILNHDTAFFTGTMAKFFQDHPDGLPTVTGPGFLINFSGGGPGGTMSVDPVPEPVSLLAILGGLAALTRLKRRP
ncbi:MAG: PEP-CTERM sorting domain-containing protein [Armatimonadetes bacterium]|nr:PEP-CTERM sorting domain-containing protein [Armatimonadota bacterium]